MFLIIYFPEYKEFIVQNLIIFAASTSLGAVFWSLYAIKKYSAFANFENAIQEAYKKITMGMKKFESVIKLFKKTGLLDLVMKSDKDKPKLSSKQILDQLEDGKLI